jgi:hypothetical protein
MLAKQGNRSAFMLACELNRHSGVVRWLLDDCDVDIASDMIEMASVRWLLMLR